MCLLVIKSLVSMALMIHCFGLPFKIIKNMAVDQIIHCFYSMNLTVLFKVGSSGFNEIKQNLPDTIISVLCLRFALFFRTCRVV